ncbi:MAG: VPLPA-CTERM sorting domain-containing protein [Gammaproteobacteria bacterium]
MTFSLRRSSLNLPLLGLLLLGAQVAAASTWTFASGGTYYVTNGSSYGNNVTFYQDNEQLHTYAWSDTGNAVPGAFEPSYIRRYSTGIGVCNPAEGDIVATCIGGSQEHQVDNIGQEDVVLFLFESARVMESLTVDPWGTWGRDVSFWVGNVSSGINLSGSTFNTLGALGFGPQHDSLNSVGSDPLTLSLGGLSGNALLVSALHPANNNADRFKIRSLTTSVIPLPATIWLFVSGLGFLGLMKRRRQVHQSGARLAG